MPPLPGSEGEPIPPRERKTGRAPYRDAKEGGMVSYKTGDLKRTVPPCEHPDCEGFWVCDSREGLYRHDDPAKPPHEKHGAYLPHSCDEWFIGGRAEVEAMIADLTAALEVLP